MQSKAIPVILMLLASFTFMAFPGTTFQSDNHTQVDVDASQINIDTSHGSIFFDTQAFPLPVNQSVEEGVKVSEDYTLNNSNAIDVIYYFEYYKNGTRVYFKDITANAPEINVNVGTVDYIDGTENAGEIFNFTAFVNYTTTSATYYEEVHTHWVKVAPPADPLIYETPPESSSAQEGFTDEVLNWTAFDLSPTTYSIYKGGSSTPLTDATNLPWESNVSVTYNDPDVIVGQTYNYTIVFTDGLGRTASDTTFLEILFDLSKPSIVSEPSNASYVYGTSLPSISWTATDDHAGSFMIYHNGDEVSTGSWISNNPVFYSPTVSTNLGIHNYTIVLADTSGNKAVNTIFITITAIPTQTPVLDVVTEVYTDSIDTIDGVWLTESGNVSNANIEALLYNSTNNLVKSIDGEIDSTGKILLNLTYSQVPAGGYYWQVTFSKDGYQSRVVNIEVNVESIGINVTLNFPEKLVQGSPYEIDVTITYADSTNSVLNLDSLILPKGPLQDRNARLTLTYAITGGGEITKSYSGTTNNQGVTTIIIPASDTIEIEQIQEYIFSIDGGYVITNQSVPVDPLSIEIVSGGIIGLEWTTLVIAIVLILAVFGGTFVYIIFGDRLAKLKPIDHLNHLRSIKMIILSKSDGIPVFEKSFDEMRTDSTMIAGLSSAISTFLDEFIENKDKGLEIMERNDLSLISHRSQNTVLTVVSTPKLPKSYQNQVILTHNDLLDEIPEDKLTQSYSSSNDNYDHVVINALHHNGIRVNLLTPMTFSSERFVEYLEFGAPNIPKVISRTKTLLKNLNLIEISIEDFFNIIQSQVDYDDDTVAELLFALDDIGMISTNISPENQFQYLR